MYAKPDNGIAKPHRLLLRTLCLSVLLLSACGKAEDLPSDVSSALSSSLKSSSVNPSDDQIKAAIPKILKGLEDIRQEIKSLKLTNITAPAGTAKPGTAPSAKPGSTAKPDPARPATGPSATPAKPPAPAASTANEDLQKVLKLLSDAPYAQATIDKTEKSFADGHVSSGKLMMYVKKPNLVKIDVLTSSAGGAGSKVLYTSDQGDKVKIRPGGALGFVVTELSKHDDRVDSTNRYTLDQLDLFGIVKRLGSGYQAELVGKTQLNGSEIHVLKLTSSAANSLDSRITYEYIGFDPSTYKLALWETYSADSQDPFMRIVISKLEISDNLPDSTFKL